ncbi:MAG: hypothetical protein ABIQ40_17490 [Bacteroidia bacterium]
MATKKTSLRESLLDSIGTFLWKEGFAKDEVTQHGILEIINQISDYHEEGVVLFPEIIVTNNFDFFKSIPNKEIIIQPEAPLTINEFKNAIKFANLFNSGNSITHPLHPTDQKLIITVFPLKDSESHLFP